MNILSIDFDYFIHVTKGQERLFPDPIDRGTFLSEIIWGSHYATNAQVLNAIGIAQKEFKLLESLLGLQDEDIPVMIANSHKHVYDFIHQYQKPTEPLRLVNIDMHPDLCNDNEELDCGNWLSYILDEYSNVSFNWVINPISLDAFRIGKQPKKKNIRTMTLPSISHITTERFDAVFMCRSDMWTPPHLDKYFTVLCDCCKSRFNSIVMERGVDSPRVEYLEMARAIVEAQILLKQHSKHKKVE